MCPLNRPHPRLLLRGPDYNSPPSTFSAHDCLIRGSQRGFDLDGVRLLSIRNSTFEDNENALTLDGSMGGEIAECRFIAPEDSTGFGTAAVFGYFLSPGDTPDFKIINNVFEGHFETQNSPSVMTLAYYSGSYIIHGNTFTRNHSPYAAVFFYAGQPGASLAFTNNIFPRTSGGPSIIVLDNAGAISAGCNVYWSNLYENPLGETDRVVSPQFCDAEKSDYRLGSGSPCLPVHSSGCGLIGALGEGCATHPVTISTLPISIPLHLDGYLHPAPILDGWVIGSNHTLEAPAHHVVNIPERYSFLQWENGSVDPIRFVDGLPGSSSYEATYFYDPYPSITLSSSPVSGLTLQLDGFDTITPHSFYAEEHETHQLFAPSPQFLTPADRYIFKEWEDGSTNPLRSITAPIRTSPIQRRSNTTPWRRWRS